MPKCIECGFTAPRLQWTHFKYKCTGKFNNGKEYQLAYPGAKLVDDELAKRTAITLDNLIKKYGHTEGTVKWNNYKNKQAISNSYDYKKEKYGWSKEQFDNYNKSRGITITKFIEKYGEEIGTEKWFAYCERQAYTNTKQYFIEKYGKTKGSEVYKSICARKTHSIEIIMERHNCSYNDAITIKENYNYDTSRYSSGLELELINKIEDELKTSIDYSTKTKQYCVYVNNGPLFYDIVHNNKAIEFNGDYWHCNPSKYPANYYHSQADMIAEEIWKKDKNKIDGLLAARGIPTLVVWEEEYLNNPTEVIKRCVEWLK